MLCVIVSQILRCPFNSPNYNSPNSNYRVRVRDRVRRIEIVGVHRAVTVCVLVWVSVKRLCTTVPVRSINSHADVYVDTQVPVTGQPVSPQPQHALCGRHDGR